MFDHLLDNRKPDIETYVSSAQPLIAAHIGLFVGLSVTSASFDDWLEVRSTANHLGTEEGEKFEFCYYCTDPTLVESLEMMFKLVVQILAIPAMVFSETCVRLVERFIVNVDLYSLWQFHEFSVIHLNIATYLILGYLIHRKT